MKNKLYYKNNNVKGSLSDIDFDDCVDMFQEGLSDVDISREFGVNEEFVRKIREEYQSDY